MRALIAAAMATSLTLAMLGCVGVTTPPAKKDADFVRMRDACTTAAVAKFDTVRGLVSFEGDPIRQPDDTYQLQGTADGTLRGPTPFRCYFNEYGRYYAVNAL